MMSSRSRRFRPSTHKRIACPEIEGYMRIVENGEVEACEEQHLLMSYVRDVFANERLFIDRWRIEEYMRYEELFPFNLFEWEKFAFSLFMCVFREDERPRWPLELLKMGRGGGKNGYDSFVAFCALTGVNGINAYNVDICANSKDQAMTSFNDVRAVLENPQRMSMFERYWKWNNDYIENLTTGSKLKARTDNPRSKDGMRSGMVIFDEVHAYRDWKNINVFTTGLGKKPHPRRLYSTSDGEVRDGVLDSLTERAERILRREIPDNGLLPLIFKLDKPEEVHEPAKRAKANPSVIYLPDLAEEINNEYADYVANPAESVDFMTKRMNCPQGNPDLEVTSWENLTACCRDIPDLTGCTCVCGVDFAKTTDFVAAGLLFRVDGAYYWIHHSWICARSRDLPRVKAPLREWEGKGILEYVDDVEVHPSRVAAWIRDMCGRYDVAQVAIDSYRHTLVMRELEEIGFTSKDGNVMLTRPSHQMLVQPKLNSVFANRSLAWGDDRMMCWYGNNAMLVAGPHGNYTYGKIEPRSRKTDGLMALVAAFAAEGAIPDYASDDELPEAFFI